jgi:hypothetical protein
MRSVHRRAGRSSARIACGSHIVPHQNRTTRTIGHLAPRFKPTDLQSTSRDRRGELLRPNETAMSSSAIIGPVWRARHCGERAAAEERPETRNRVNHRRSPRAVDRIDERHPRQSPSAHGRGRAARSHARGNAVVPSPWQATLLDRVCRGASIRQSAREMGVSYMAAYWWWRDAGAMRLRKGKAQLEPSSGEDAGDHVTEATPHYGTIVSLESVG